ncbi:MAG: DUF350 domain-containing protein [Planctomycetota bacterium]
MPLLLLGFLVLLVLLVLDRIIDRVLGGGRRPAAAAHELVAAAELATVFLFAGHATAAASGSGSSDWLWALAFGGLGLLTCRVVTAFGLHALFGRGLFGGGLAAASTAAGTVACGYVLATGIVGARVFAGGDAGGLVVALVFFAVSQVSLHLLVWLFRRLTRYDDAAEVARGNAAAGLAHAGLGLAVALLVAHAADGEFLGYADSLREYGFALLAGVALYPVRQLLVQTLVLGHAPALLGGALDDRVAAGDLGAGACEAATYVGTALFVVALT